MNKIHFKKLTTILKGLATFAAALADTKIGISLAIAITLHNIPEGVAVSIPIFYATGNKYKGLLIASISGFSEVLGALFGYVFLLAFISPSAFGFLFGSVSGMMISVVIKDLIPTAREYSEKYVNLSIFLGMFFMSINLCMFA